MTEDEEFEELDRRLNHKPAPKKDVTVDDIRAYFKSKGVSQREVAKFIDVDDRTVRRWFSGKGTPPPRLFILAIQADIFNVEYRPSERVVNHLVLKEKK